VKESNYKVYYIYVSIHGHMYHSINISGINMSIRSCVSCT